MEDTLYSNEELEAALGSELRRYYPEERIDHGAIRVSSIFDTLRTAIKNRDPVAVNLGCTLIVADPRLPFGKLIKSGISRALRQRVDMVSVDNRLAIVQKTLELLGLPFAPREVEDYCKLVRAFDSEEWHHLLKDVNTKNEKAKSLLSYLAAEQP